MTVFATNGRGKGPAVSEIAYVEEDSEFYKILILGKYKYSVPGPPRDIAVEAVDESQILVTWTALSPVEARGHITHYTVYYWPSSNSSQIMSSTVVGNVTRYLISNLLTGVSYRIQVSANTSIGEGERSIFKEASTRINGIFISGTKCS